MLSILTVGENLPYPNTTHLKPENHDEIFQFLFAQAKHSGCAKKRVVAGTFAKGHFYFAVNYCRHAGEICPATIWPSIGYYNDGNGGAYTDESDPQMVRDRYIASVRSYYEGHIARAQAHVDAGRTEYAPEIEGYRQRIADAEVKGPGKYPS